MTYYQELGVDPGATADEIRRAYRQQIKVFHPDRQTDERMRVVAEAKLRRLNEIVQVLGDPEQRRAYDYELLLLHRGRPGDDLRSVAVSRFQTSAAIVVVVALAAGILVWALRSSESLPEGESTEIESKLQKLPAAPQEPRKIQKANPGTPPAVRTASVAAPPPASSPTVLNAAVRPAPLPVQVPVAAPPSVPAPPPAASPAQPAPAMAGAPSNPLVGTWLFQRAPPQVGQEKLYPPRYIELKIQPGSGMIFGRFRSSYEVHDQALSPNVNFDFQAPVATSQTKATWLGPGGAQGSVELKLLNPMNLQVDWKADRTAPGLDLVSGTAVLVRRLDN